MSKVRRWLDELRSRIWPHWCFEHQKPKYIVVVGYFTDPVAELCPDCYRWWEENFDDFSSTEESIGK